MKMAIGADTACHITTTISEYIARKNIELQYCGALAGREADYVDTAREVAEKVAGGECELGLCFCNTGTGVTIIANKIPGARAALCIDLYSARTSRLANNANILVLSMRNTGEGLAKEIVDTWLDTAPSDEPRRKTFHRKTDEIDAEYRRRRG